MNDFIFDGFEASNTTPVPDVLFDVLLPHLNEAQLKVMLYIIRRTLGFKKTADAISLKQFRFGITTKDEKVLDEGCGLKNFTTISKALKALERMNCIESVKAQTADGDAATTVYRILFRGTTVNVVPTTVNVVGVLRQTDDRATPTVVGVLRQTESQETVLQERDLQETVLQERERRVVAIAPTAPALPASSENDEDTQKRAAVKINTNIVHEPPAPPKPSRANTNVTIPKRPRQKPITMEPDTIPVEAVAILDRWDSVHTKPAPRTPKAVQAAKLLMVCDPSAAELKACADWLYTTDRPGRPWYRAHGVHLPDIAENISKWQGLQDALPDKPPGKSNGAFDASGVLAQFGVTQEVGT